MSKENTLLEVEVTNFNNITLETLKTLYARVNKSKIGIYSYSIYYTYCKKPFGFSRPFVANDVITGELSKVLLEDYQIIPDDSHEIYGEIIEEDDVIVVSLSNNKMIDIDNKYIEGEDKYVNKIYRPYFYEFIVDNSSRDSLLANYEFNIQYKVSLEYRNLNKLNLDDDERDMITGELFYSASPPKTIPAYISMLEKVTDSKKLREIKSKENYIKKSIKSITNKKEIENEFVKTVPCHYIPKEVTAYNVGQGNWTKVRLSSNHTSKKYFDIIFDIGVSNSNEKNNRYKKNADKAAKDILKKSMFILSHWDLDHIKGIIYLRKEQFHKTWIVPQLSTKSKSSKSAMRLAIYLDRNSEINSLFISEKLNGQNIFDDGLIKIGKGYGDRQGKMFKGAKTHFNDKNNLGLVLIAKGEAKRFLLPGDCEYRQFPDSLLKECDLMLASHHGAETNFENIIFKTLGTCEKASYFTVNCKGKLPHETQVDKLSQLGYRICKLKQDKTWNI